MDNKTSTLRPIRLPLTASQLASWLEERPPREVAPWRPTDAGLGEYLYGDLSCSEFFNRLLALAISTTGAERALFLGSDSTETVASVRAAVWEGFVRSTTEGLQLVESQDGRGVRVDRWVAATGKVALLPVTQQTTPGPTSRPIFQDSRSCLAAAVRYAGQLQGILVLESANGAAFGESEASKLETLARKVSLLYRRVEFAQHAWGSGQKRAPFFLGTQGSWEAVMEQIEKLASFNGVIVLQGESGTGKELVARQLHFDSSRRNGPFIAVNCAAVPAELLESELFGHKNGAFTSATQDRKGRFELAHGGTLFLDEVAKSTHQLQGKLLRAIEYNEIWPVGAQKPLTDLDVKLMVAVNRDLDEHVAAGDLHADFAHRLGFVRIKVPALREYREEIPSMARAYLRFYSRGSSHPSKDFSAAALRVLRDYPFPGNVRELAAAVEFAAQRASGPLVELCDLPGPVAKASRRSDLVRRMETEVNYYRLKQQADEDFLREYLPILMTKAGGNLTRAAELSGLHRATLHRFFKSVDIDPSRYRPEGSSSKGTRSRRTRSAVTKPVDEPN